MDVLHQAEAVAFLRALREVGSLHLERIDNHAFVLRFEAVTSLEQLRSSFFFKSNISLEKLFEKYGIDLFRLLQEEAG